MTVGLWAAGGDLMTTGGMLGKQHVLLLGASGDLGLAMAERFLAEGAMVTGTAARHPERLQPLSEKFGEAFRAIPLDVTDPASLETALETVKGLTPPDAMVYNIGITRDGPALGLEDSDWNTVIEVNLSGAFRATRTFGRLFFRQKRGRLLFVSSVAGQRGGRGQANYAAAKGGLEAFVRSLAVDLAPRGILVNAIAPGPVESKMTTDVMATAGDEVLRRIPLGRLARPGEVAALAAHLLAPDLTYLTGQTIAIDGGFRG